MQTTACIPATTPAFVSLAYCFTFQAPDTTAEVLLLSRLLPGARE